MAFRHPAIGCFRAEGHEIGLGKRIFLHTGKMLMLVADLTGICSERVHDGFEARVFKARSYLA